jgi:hypothetical protein
MSVSAMTQGMLVALALTVACGPSQKEPDEPQINIPLKEGVGDGTPVTEDPPPEEGALSEDQKAMIKVALRRGGDKAAQCAGTVPDGKTFGEGEVQVTFDGKIGKVTEAIVGPPFSGTEMEPCIKRSFVNEYALTFDGAPLTVPYTVKLEKKTTATPPKKK